ncbi:MAG TPA: hypothetical protein VEF33_09565 [Syntrophales bacterium]|nr:hypothetical protein [Syntrophales bacterium]
MTEKVLTLPLLVLLFLLVFGCGGLRYSQVEPEAKNYHPKRVGLFPVDVGTYEEARGVIDKVIAGVLVDRGWFAKVIDADMISCQIQSNKEIRTVCLDYFSKLKEVNFSDPELSKKIGEKLEVDAFLVANLDYWNYTKLDDDKVAKVDIGIKMIDAASGKIIWKAGHQEVETYMLIKPKLPDVAKGLVKKIIKEMPH